MLRYLLIIFLVYLSACSETNNLRVRPSDWATPIINTSLKNGYKVDQGIYRSEQPNKTEFLALSEFGIKEILNLREYHSDQDNAADLPLRLHRIKVDTSSIDETQLIEALRIIKNRQGPILVHCWHGSDRTGAVIAAYRIIFNDWTKEKAIDELANGGYGYHDRIYPNIVQLIENMNIKKIKNVLNITSGE